MAFPSNEEETITLFRLLQNRFGWQIVESRKNVFPDAIIENKDGLRLNCEFEFVDRNFQHHQHPVDGSCDLIICWKAKWKTPPLPVWELSQCATREAQTLEALLSRYAHKKDLRRFNHKIAMLKRAIEEREQEIDERDEEIKEQDKELERLSDLDRRIEKISGDISCTVMACGIFFWGLYQLLDWLIRTF